MNISNPGEVDKAVRKAWDKIRRGKVDEAGKIIEGFMRDFKDDLFRMPTQTIKKLDGPQLFAILSNLDHSAGGLDGFTPEDLTLVSPHAAQLLADMLNCIEDGAAWPMQLNKGRAAFLAKDLEKLDDCTNYRILTILPIVYRVWAKARLEDLKPWVQHWKCPEMFAGVDFDGAEDAWWQTGIKFEKAALNNQAITGGTADVYKCFDQILRDLLKLLLVTGGMPRRVVDAYTRYMDTLTVVNAVASSLGEPYHLPTGIPQGCPLSMMFIAFMLRPWIMQTRRLGAVPRVLADDILVFAQGDQHEKVFQQAFDNTHAYIAKIGGLLAPAKSTAFSTMRVTRQKLRNHIWKEVGQTIRVVLHGRDLGAHLSTGAVL